MHFLKLKAEVIKEVKKNSKFQFDDGSFEAGHNGPYRDAETPVRNTAHFLYALCTIYELNGDQELLDSAKKSLHYLLNNDYINPRGVYTCRLAEGKDATNGLIGHAWIIEALIKAGDVLGSEARIEAERLWKIHRFDYSLGAWAKPNSDTDEPPSYDHTFNHQLWFAACIAPLGGFEVDRQIRCFIQKNVSRLVTYKNGVIYHRSPIGSWANWVGKDPVMGLRKLLSPLKNRNQKREMYLHSVSYHTFNLYAFAMLVESGYEDDLYRVFDLEVLVQCLKENQFTEDLLKLPNIGIRYNPSGIEAAYALKVLCYEKDQTTIKKWIDFQLEETYSDKGILANMSPDEATSLARIYEATRLLR